MFRCNMSRGMFVKSGDITLLSRASKIDMLVVSQYDDDSNDDDDKDDEYDDDDETDIEDAEDDDDPPPNGKCPFLFVILFGVFRCDKWTGPYVLLVVFFLTFCQNVSGL